MPRHPSTAWGAQNVPASQLFRASLLRVLVDAAKFLGDTPQGPVSRRRLVNFLRGSQAPGPLDVPALKDLYGLLEAVTATWLHEFLDALVEYGILTIAHGGRGSQKLSVDLTECLSLSTDPLELARLFPVRPRLGSNHEVEDQLRSLRAELARQEGRAPHGIFPNATLAVLATSRPSTLAELAQMPGMGEARVRKYGSKVLAVLAALPRRLVARAVSCGPGQRPESTCRRRSRARPS